MKIVAVAQHAARDVDPFGLLPCDHEAITVHTTDAKSLGDDLVECRECGYALRLADLYASMIPPGGIATILPS